MYDEVLKTIELSSDEIDILKDVLFYRLDKCLSLGEELTVKGLLEKLTN